MYNRKKYSGYEKVSFSAVGEDLILDHWFKSTGINLPTYLEIGAIHPFINNYTYLFYQQGGRGVNIVTDKEKIPLFERIRPQDSNLAALVSQNGINTDKPVYIIKEPFFYTEDIQEALKVQSNGPGRIKKVATVKTVSLLEIFSFYFNDKAPDLLVMPENEMKKWMNGQDALNRLLPKALCIKRQQMFNNQISQNIAKVLHEEYSVYADNPTSTILIRTELAKLYK